MTNFVGKNCLPPDYVLYWLILINKYHNQAKDFSYCVQFYYIVWWLLMRLEEESDTKLYEVNS